MDEQNEHLMRPARGAGLARTQPACIINTKYEKLAKKFSDENEVCAQQKNLQRQKENLQRQVIRMVVSVYHFARAEMRMPFRPLTPEEFHEIHQYIKGAAERIIADPLKLKRRFWQRRTDPSAGWRHYLQYGCFPPHRVFGLPLWYKCGVESNSIGCLDFLNWADLPVDYSRWPKWRMDNEESVYVPPNIKELVATLLKEELIDGRYLGTLHEHAGE